MNRNNSFFSQSTEDLAESLTDFNNTTHNNSSKNIIQKVFKDNTNPVSTKRNFFDAFLFLTI